MMQLPATCSVHWNRHMWVGGDLVMISFSYKLSTLVKKTQVGAGTLDTWEICMCVSLGPGGGGSSYMLSTLYVR